MYQFQNKEMETKLYCELGKFQSGSRCSRIFDGNMKSLKIDRINKLIINVIIIMLLENLVELIDTFQM